MAIQNSLAKKQKKTGLTVFLERDAVKNQINQVVGGKNGTRFISNIVSAVQTTPDLQECTNQSIVSAALLGEALNLSISPQLGQFYLVPFNNNKEQCKEAQFQLGYKGLMQLAQRSGQYLDIDAFEIREGEYLGRDKYTGKQKFEFIEDDEERETLPVIGYMAYFELLNGFRKTIYWSKKKMQLHAETYSFAYNQKTAQQLEKGEINEKDRRCSSFWYKNFDEMARKTMLRQLFQKYGAPMSIDMQTAVINDMAVIREDGTPEYIDNTIEKQEEVVEEQDEREAEQPQSEQIEELNGQMSIEEAFFS